MPFDITIALANEYGAGASAKLFGVEILNEGFGTSIDDTVIEQQATFVAQTIAPLQALGNATKEGSREQINIPVGTHDLVSAFYSLRTFDLTPKKKADAISAMTVDYPRVVKVESLQRETIELNGQKIAAIALKVTTDDPQPDRLQIRIWVGDDGRHLPLRIAALTDLGPVHADLIVVPSSSK